MYNLAAKGPWTNPVLQKLLFGAGANIDERKLKLMLI